ncbi:MAG: roadblock/LC7 domain-containing protein, partial [Promethearchaeota archaeon]
NSSGVYGDYNITMYNASNIICTNFSYYHNNKNNITEPWIVLDEGVGIYQLYSTWNDTDNNNQTKRLGWWKDTFEIHRKTTGRVFHYPEGFECTAGQNITYIVEFNQTLGQSGIENAEVLCYRDSTDNLWGTDWAPYDYLVESYTYIGEGNYSIGISTLGVPKSNYSIYFKIQKEFYDINITNCVYLNITGVLYNISVSYQYGAFNNSGDLVLNSWNIPCVNDTSSIIQVKLTNVSAPADVIRDSYVSANINGSNTIMNAIEQYAYTHLEKDKGVYNLTIDTTGLNITDQINNFNYTLDIAFSASGYNPLFHDVTISVNPIPLSIEMQPIESIYENNSINIETTLSLNKTGELESCNFGVMNWSLYNNDSEYLMGGVLQNVLNNFYSAEVTFINDYYLEPGNYYIEINASGYNLQTTISSKINFTIFEKYTSNISLIVPETVRIGHQISISAHLTYINSTIICNQDILFTINYSETYSYQVIVQTDENGKAIYDLTIDSYYEGENLTILAEYTPLGIILPSSAYLEKEIFGKTPVNISFIDPPDYVRTGYNVTFAMNLTILNEQNYKGKIVFLFGFYDLSLQPFIIRELSTDSSGGTSYTLNEIEDGHDNITIYFEYLGSAKVESKIENYSCPIYPKWNVSLSIDNFPTSIRIGQDVEFNVSANFSDSSCNETFHGLPLNIIYNYTNGPISIEYFIEESEKISPSFTIPQACGSWLNVTLDFGGTTKIQSFQITYQYLVLPKWDLSLTIDGIPESIRIGQDLLFDINATFLNISCNEIFFGLPLNVKFDYEGVQIVKEKFFNEFEKIEHAFTIPQACGSWLNITLEFSGTDRIKSFQITYQYPVLPKWSSIFLIDEFPSEIRLGQLLFLNFTLYSEEDSFSESFDEMPIEFCFKYSSFEQTFNYSSDKNGNINFYYEIPTSGVSEFNLTAVFLGTDKISDCFHLSTIILLPRRATTMNIITFPSGQYFTGTLSYSVNITDDENISLAGLNIRFYVYDTSENLINTYVGVTNEYGAVTVLIKLLNPGDFIIKAVFEGESIYDIVETAEISVHMVTYATLFVEKLPQILLILAMVFISGFIIRRTLIIPRRIRKVEELKSIHQRFLDVENIQHILILSKSGLSIFSKSFSNIPIDGTLISGFLTAISSFGEEIGGKMIGKGKTNESSGKKGLEQLAFHQFKIMISDRTLVRVAVLLLKNASPSLKNKIRRFSNEFQNEYKEMLINWTGKIPKEDPILEMIEKYLEVDLLYPHNINLGKLQSYMNTQDKKSIGRLILEVAQNPEHNNTFIIRDMIHDLMIRKKETVIFNGIDNLRNERIVFAVNTRTQYLFDQFKPIIEKLPLDSKILLSNILEGITDELKLRKIKGLINFDESLYLLREMNLINNENKPTENGEAVGTILKLIQDV